MLSAGIVKRKDTQLETAINLFAHNSKIDMKEMVENVILKLVVMKETATSERGGEDSANNNSAVTIY